MKPRIIISLMLLGLLAACGGGGPAEKPPYPGIKLGKPYEIYGHWYKPHYNADYDEIGVASWYGPGFHGGHTANGERFDQDAMTAAHKTLPLPSIVRVTNLENGLSAIVKVNDRGPFAHDRIMDLSRGAARKLGVIRTGTAKVRVQFLEKETREYVENLQSGTRYAMNAMNRVDPDEAAAREEAGAQPVLKITPRMFPDDNAMEAPPRDEFSVVDNTPSPQAHYRPATYRTSTPAPQSFASPANSSYFVQAGTFGLRDNALKLIDRIDDEDGPQIMEVVMGGRKFYRVMVGPYEVQADAKNMLSKLTSIGISDAKIVHN